MIIHVEEALRTRAKSFAAAASLVLACTAQANALPGDVGRQQKISDREGGFTGVLDNADTFGVGVTSLGYVNGDAVPDLAVGVSGDDDGGANHGAVYVLFLGRDGTVRAHQKISDTEGNFTGPVTGADAFGGYVAGIGDLDGNGVGDLAVSAELDDDGGGNRGAVWILLLGPDGKVVSEQKISDLAGGFGGHLDDHDRFGAGIAPVGDLDGDGNIELAVGAYQDDDGGTDLGAVYILFLNDTHTVKSVQKLSNTSGGLAGALTGTSQFGIAIANLGDLNLDGIPDIAVGANLDNDGGTRRGALWVLFLDADGTVKSHQKISDTQGNFKGVLDDIDLFGGALASPGDLNLDGVPDLAVGAKVDADGGSERGAVWILFLDRDGTVQWHRKISSTKGDFVGPLDNKDEFGTSVTALGDFDGDGSLDIAVGAALDDDGGMDRGAVWLLSLEGPVLDHFACYDVTRDPGEPAFTAPDIELLDQFSSSALAVSLGNPLRLCAPALKNGERVNNPRAHLVCYEITDQINPNEDVLVSNQLEDDVAYTVGNITTLCVPSNKAVAGQ